MNEVYLLLGSNEGNRMQWMQRAIDMLSAHGTIALQSSVYETAAWGIEDQPGFLNMVVLLQTMYTPTRLLTGIHIIEKALGRQREVKWGPRTLDIDILLYNNEQVEFPGLIIPHPFLHLRRFTLVPLAELIPTNIHPTLNRTITELLQDCPDQLEVQRYTGN